MIEWSIAILIDKVHVHLHPQSWNDFVIATGPILLSTFSIISIWLMGRMWRYAWAYSFFLQILWLIWITESQQYGFLPVTLTYMILSVLNHFKWKKKLRSLNTP